MKVGVFILGTMFLLLLSSCVCKNNRMLDDRNIELEKNRFDSLYFQKIQKNLLVGYFSDPKKQDTIFQCFYSEKYGKELDSIPLPYYNDHLQGASKMWFDDHEVSLYLILKKDTLSLDYSYGLYCLINMGDLNADGKDEIALSVDNIDYSACNSCSIYTICQDRWTLLKQFAIHESAFDFVSDTIPVFEEIKGFLERNNGRWEYVDYFDYLRENEPKKLLTLDKCP